MGPTDMETRVHLVQTWTPWALAHPPLAHLQNLMWVFDSSYYVSTPTPCQSWGFGNELELLPGRSSPSGGRDLPVKKTTCPLNIWWKINTFVCSDTPCKTLLKTVMPQRPTQGSRNLSFESWFSPHPWAPDPASSHASLSSLCALTTLQLFQLLKHGSLFPPQPFPTHTSASFLRQFTHHSLRKPFLITCAHYKIS